MGRTSTARERLVAAMAALVHRRGYLAVGVDDVCRAAGVKKGSFYYFFASKRDLMLAALDYQGQTARDKGFGPVFRSTLPPLQRIERLLDAAAEMETSNKSREGHVLGCPFGNLAAEVGKSEPALTKRADEGMCDISDQIRRALSEAKRLGQLERRVDVHAAADAIMAYFEGLALVAKARNEPSLIRRLGRRALLLATEPAKVRKTPRKARSRKNQ